MTDSDNARRKARARLYDWGDYYYDIINAGYAPLSLEYRLMSEGTDGARSTGGQGYGAVLAAVIEWGDRISVHNAVRGLPEIHQYVLSGKYIARLSGAELARVLDEPTKRVLHRVADGEESVARYLYPQAFPALDNPALSSENRAKSL